VKTPARNITKHFTQSGYNLDVCCLRSLGTLTDLVAHGVTFIESAVSVTRNRAVVDEQVRTLLLLNEPKALFGVEPFNDALLCHFSLA
jgi:hypothetical protein